MHSSNMPILFLTLLKFHFLISGKEIKDKQFENILFKLVAFSVFHFEISGKKFTDSQ